MMVGETDDDAGRRGAPTLHADGALAGYSRSPHPCPGQASFARDALPGRRRLTGSFVEEAE